MVSRIGLLQVVHNRPDAPAAVRAAHERVSALLAVGDDGEEPGGGEEPHASLVAACTACLAARSAGEAIELVDCAPELVEHRDGARAEILAARREGLVQRPVPDAEDFRLPGGDGRFIRYLGCEAS